MQTTQEKRKNEQKQLIALGLLGLSILIGFFFTKEQYYSYAEKSDALETTKKDTETKKDALKKLETLSKEIKNNVSLQSDIERYAGSFREDEIFNSIFTPISGINIGSVSITPGEKLTNGLSLANISISFRAQDLTSLNQLLEYLTTSKINKKSYIIKNFSFPLDFSKNEPISSNIELGMYYFE